jgi:hypothetical protein
MITGGLGAVLMPFLAVSTVLRARSPVLEAGAPVAGADKRLVERGL